LGILSLGIYAIHPLLSVRLHLVENYYSGDEWMIIVPLSTYLSAAFISYVMSKFSYLKNFVM
jgi:hypothetical protein